MYNSIKLQNFRAFPLLEVTGLKRVNLLVGRNNAGKTSILEALELLSSGGYPGVLFKPPSRREERIYATEERPRFDVDIRHLFTGHRLDETTWFEISGQQDSNSSFFKCSVESQADFFDEQRLAIKLTGSKIEQEIVIPLSEDGVLLNETLRVTRSLSASTTPVNFLGTEGADASQLRKLWDTLVLTPEEGKVYEALYSIAPNLERIAFTSDRRSPGGTTTGVFVKLKDSARLPLGSMGDGIRRLLGLAIFLVKSAGGYLLIDEIDTGLHYSTMEEMWRFIIQTAERLNVQVFATTHSGDCLRSLAWLQQDQPEFAEQVVLHRIEADAIKSVRCSAEELEIATRHHIEVRG